MKIKKFRAEGTSNSISFLINFISRNFDSRSDSKKFAKVFKIEGSDVVEFECRSEIINQLEKKFTGIDLKFISLD